MSRGWKDFDPEAQEESTAMRLRSAYRGALREASKTKWVLYASQILSSVAIPAAVAYCVNLITGTDTAKRDFGVAGLTFLIFAQTLLVIGLLIGPSIPSSVLQDLEEIENNREAWRTHDRSIEHLAAVFTSAIACSESASRIAIDLLNPTEADPTEPVLKDALEKILDPYFRLRGEALNFSRKAGKYTVTVFALDVNSLELFQVYSRRDEGLPQRNRRLSVERSHAGQAAVSQRCIITDDARVTKEFLEQYDLEDSQNYRSMASFPIYDGGSVFGACTVTCDVPDQFSDEGANALFSTLGGILSLYLSSRRDGEANAG